MVGCTRVDKPYIFWFGGVGRFGGSHGVRSMPYHKHSTTIFVIGVGGVVCEGRLTVLFATLYLIVAELATVSALGRVVLSAWYDMIAPPSS